MCMVCLGAQNIGGVLPKGLQKQCTAKGRKKDSQVYLMALAVGEANQPKQGLFGKTQVMNTHTPSNSFVSKVKAGGGRQSKLLFK